MMHLKICLVFLCLLLCQLQHVSSLRTRGMWSMSLMSMVSSGDSDASSNAAISITSDVTASSVPDGVVCEDGVCTLPSSTTKASSEEEHVTPETFNLYPTVDEESVEELMKMGWTKEDSTTALKKTKNDITAAAEWLQEEQDKEEAFEASVQNITAMGWVADMARAALNETDGNVTEALSILQLEEDNIVSNFEVAVQDMLQNGWEEIVARQALLAQWTLDQRKSLGFNDTFTREHLDKIRPTLKQNNDSRQSLNKELDNDSKSVPDVAAPAASTTAKKTKDASKKKAEPKPAKKEDVVFEVTAATFQKVVLESPVPVLLDVYADWCGPCKQLGPMLEEAAIRAGGMFRLAKLNSDNERSVVECLEVPGLPTVFAVVKGKINDRFVGMIQGEQIQQFLVRAVTGYGERVTEKELTDKDFDAMTERVTNIAGLASISFKKKEKLFQLVSEAMDQDDAFITTEDGSRQPHPGVKVALAYIENCRKDVLNPKFRVISTTSKAYVEKVSLSSAAQRLLEIAGFRAAESKDAAASNEQIELIHSNAAILSLVGQRINSEIAEKKYAKMKKSSVSLESKKDNYAIPPKAADSTVPATPKVIAKPVASSKSAPSADAVATPPRKTKAIQKDEAVVSFRGVVDTNSEDDAVITKKLTLKKNLTLKNALESLLEDEDVKLPSRDISVEIKYPLPRRQVDDKTLKMKLEDLVGKDQSINLGSIVKSTKKSASKTTSTKESKFGGFFGKKKVENKSKTNTLFSTGILDTKDKKHNEYFGGDSTVTLAGDEEEQEDGEEEEEEGKENDAQEDEDEEEEEEDSESAEEDDDAEDNEEEEE